MAEQWRPDFRQYPSVTAELAAATSEFQRYLESGIAAKVDPAALQDRFPQGHLNKLGVILKIRRDGTKKTRLIIDMRRSEANERASVPERPTLPRPTDPSRRHWSICTRSGRTRRSSSP